MTMCFYNSQMFNGIYFIYSIKFEDCFSLIIIENLMISVKIVKATKTYKIYRAHTRILIRDSLHILSNFSCAP